MIAHNVNDAHNKVEELDLVPVTFVCTQVIIFDRCSVRQDSFDSDKLHIPVAQQNLGLRALARY